MAASRTFSIIKPDATRRNLTGAINSKIEESGLRIVAQRRIHMTREQAKSFYAVHAERPFYDDLMRLLVQSANYLLSLLKLILYMALIAMKTQQLRLPTSLRRRTLLANILLIKL